jgi:allantoinase
MSIPRPTADLVIRAHRVLIDGQWQSAAVIIRRGVITALTEIESAVEAKDDVRLDEDTVLIPGLVDTHVHVNEPGRTEWEGFATATRAAAAGGVTTLIDMPLNSVPPTTTVEALDLKRAAAAPQSVVNVGFWGGAVPGNLGTLRSLHDAGVFGFKAFLSPSGVEEFPHLSTDQLNAALQEIGAFGGVLLVHAEDPARLQESATDGPGYGDFLASRPEESETSAIEQVINGVRRTGTRAHILHLSAASALPILRAAKATGLPITVETCPHYLIFDAEHIPDGGTQYKCCPPIRDAANGDLLWQGLLDGTIDFIASDHSPATAELKLAHAGDFGRAWGGISGLQVSLAGVWTAARQRGIDLATVLRWMSTATADFVRLWDKGRIAVGSDADLVAFAPEATVQVSADDLWHRNKISAYDGRRLHGAVGRTWVGGITVDPSEASVLGDRLLTRPLDRRESAVSPVFQED